MNDAGKKVKFIMFWYNSQSKKFNNIQRLELLRQWIDICVKYEEYEMASSLRKERCEIMKQYRKESRGISRRLRRIVVFAKYVARRLRRLLS